MWLRYLHPAVGPQVPLLSLVSPSLTPPAQLHTANIASLYLYARSVGVWEEPFDYTVYCVRSDGHHSFVTGMARHGMARLWDKRSSKPLQVTYAYSGLGVMRCNVGRVIIMYFVSFILI